MISTHRRCGFCSSPMPCTYAMSHCFSAPLFPTFPSPIVRTFAPCQPRIVACLLSGVTRACQQRATSLMFRVGMLNDDDLTGILIRWYCNGGPCMALDVWLGGAGGGQTRGPRSSPAVLPRGCARVPLACGALKACQGEEKGCKERRRCSAIPLGLRHARVAGGRRAGPAAMHLPPRSTRRFAGPFRLLSLSGAHPFSAPLSNTQMGRCSRPHVGPTLLLWVAALAALHPTAQAARALPGRAPVMKQVR